MNFPDDAFQTFSNDENINLYVLEVLGQLFVPQTEFV